MQFGYVVTQARPPVPSLTVVVKATFRLVPGGECTLAPEQAPPSAEVHHDDDPKQSVRYDSDFAVNKVRGECFVAGSCYAPGGRPVPASGVAFRVGRVAKALAVFGDRRWKRFLLLSRLTAPE